MANPIDSEWEDITPQGNDSDWEDVTNQKKTYQESFSPSQEALRGTIPGVGLKAFEGVQNFFNKGGQSVAEGLAQGSTMTGNIPGTPIPLFKSTPGKNKVNPYVAGAIGGTIASAPDIAATVLSPEVQGVSEKAIPFARRALGFSKGMLKTPFARGQATKAAEVGLEQGIVGSSPQRMFDKASDLAAKSKTGIEQILKKTPADYSQAINDLDYLRGQLTQGVKEGVYKATNKAIDDVQQSLAELQSGQNGLFGKNSKATSINILKNKIGKSLNYLADPASQAENKAVVTTLANTIRRMVEKVVPAEEFVQYLRNQKLFNAAELMQKGLNNEISGQMGNNAVSLPSLVAGAASGDPTKAVAATGIFEAAKRGGAGVAANAIQGAYRQSPRIGYGAGRSAQEISKKPKKVRQNGYTYTLNEETGEYE